MSFQRGTSEAHREEPKFGQTLLEDLGSGDLQRSMRRDLEDVYQFYLDDASRQELDEMGRVSRWAHLVFWVLKYSILKLSPARRLLLLGGVLLFTQGLLDNLNAVSLVMGFGILLFTLMLELKDKLLAQDELATGRAVQFALMPPETVSMPGWEAWLYTRPANDVGGDLVDALEGPEQYGLALGDVAGKGLGAALYMAKLQATLRALAPGSATLADLGSAVNHVFVRDGLPDRFVSLVYLDVTPGAGIVRVLNAGHFPPIVVRSGRLQVLKKGGPALGILAEAGYEEQAATLDPGDLLVVYSDGLVEARDEQGVFFEDERLKALLPSLSGLSAEAAGRRLVQAVDGFIGDARPHDDLSLIVLRRLEAPAAPRLVPAPQEDAAV